MVIAPDLLDSDRAEDARPADSANPLLEPSESNLFCMAGGTRQRSVTVELQGTKARGRIETPINGLSRCQAGRHVDSLSHQSVDVHVIFPTPSNLDHPHLHVHACQIRQ